MSIVATCNCGKSFQAKPELAGRQVQCPACGQPFTIPIPAQQPAAVNDPLGIGGAAGFQPQQPASPQPQMATVQPRTAAKQTKASGKKKSNALLYILLGVGGVIVIGGIGAVIVVVALILPAVRQAREAAQRSMDQAAVAANASATSSPPVEPARPTLQPKNTEGPPNVVEAAVVPNPAVAPAPVLANDDRETASRKKIYRALSPVEAKYAEATKTINILAEGAGGKAGQRLKAIADANRQTTMFAIAQNYRKTVEQLEEIIKEGNEKNWPK